MGPQEGGPPDLLPMPVAEALGSGKPVALSLISPDDLALDSGDAYPTLGLVRVFFPDGMRLVEKVLGDAGIPLEYPAKEAFCMGRVDMLFPQWAISQCPEHRLDVTSAGLQWGATEVSHLRNPLLIPHQLLGASISLDFISMAGCLVAMAQRVPPPTKWGRRRTLAHWGAACVFYIGMSVASFLAHNVFEPRTGSWELFWTIDAMCTGIASINLFIGGLVILLSGSASLPTSPYTVILFQCFLCVVGRHLAVATSVPFRHELLYLLPAACAGIVVSPALVALTIHNPEARHGMLWYHLFSLPLLLAPAMDQFWCWLFSDMAFGAIHQVFLCCGLMMGAAMHSVISVAKPIPHASLQSMKRAADAVKDRGGRGAKGSRGGKKGR